MFGSGLDSKDGRAESADRRGFGFDPRSNPRSNERRGREGRCAVGTDGRAGYRRGRNTPLDTSLDVDVDVHAFRRPTGRVGDGFGRCRRRSDTEVLGANQALERHMPILAEAENLSGIAQEGSGRQEPKQRDDATEHRRL